MKIPWKSLKVVFYFLLCLEICFQVGGFIAQSAQYWGNAFESHKDGAYRIMCIGESMTMVGGEDSYPSQLEVILNNRAKGNQKFQVINQGVGGATTTMVIQRLQQWVDTYKPQMAIVMIGALDTLNNDGASILDHAPGFLKRVRLIQLAEFLKQRITEEVQERLARFKGRHEEKIIIDAMDEFKEALAQQSDDIKKLYLLIVIAEGEHRYDIAQTLYQKFFEINRDPKVYDWMIKKYGHFLNTAGFYEDFVDRMDEIPWRSWDFSWVKAYCHSVEHMEKVRAQVEKIVTKDKKDSYVYANVASCYEEGGRHDLAKIYYKKMGEHSSYHAALTRSNYKRIKDAFLSRGIQPVFVQYPTRTIEPLLDIFEYDPDRSKIIFVDNKQEFLDAVGEKGYGYCFVDRMFGDIGHATRVGNHMLASNIAEAILKKIH